MTRKLIPNSTQIPDLIIDEWMPKLSHPEFKVVIFIARKTFGWGKSSDTLSIGQIVEGTGVSRRAVIEATAALSKEDGPLIHVPSDLPKGHPQAWGTFGLNTEWECDNRTSTGASDAPVREMHPCKKSMPTGAKSARQPVQEMHTTRDTITRNTKTRDNSPQTPTEETETFAGILPPLADDLLEADSWDSRPRPLQKPTPPPSQGRTQAQSASAEGREVCGAARPARPAKPADTRQTEIDAFLAEHPWCADELSRRGDTATRSRVGLEYSVVSGWIEEPETMPEKPKPPRPVLTKEQKAEEQARYDAFVHKRWMREYEERNRATAAPPAVTGKPSVAVHH